MPERHATLPPGSGPAERAAVAPPLPGPAAGPWIDTHCHLDEFEAHAGRDYQDRVRADAARDGVAHCVVPAVELGNMDTVRALAHRHGDSYALGIHPLFTGRAGDGDLDALARALEQHAQDPRLVAVGEIGLDFFVKDLDPERQAHFFREQLKLARRWKLPVILHTRRSVDKVLKGLRDVGAEGGIAHAFNGSLQQARAFIDLGFKLGFGGAVTFDRALQLRRLAAELPLESIVLETDAPDIPPHWLYVTAAEREAGAAPARNTPGELPRIAQVVARLRGTTAVALGRAVHANSLAALPRLAGLVPGAPARD